MTEYYLDLPGGECLYSFMIFSLVLISLGLSILPLFLLHYQLLMKLLLCSHCLGYIYRAMDKMKLIICCQTN